MTEVQQDINATIAAAVNAQVSARVAESLAGDDLIKTMVIAAVGKPFVVRDPGSYRDRTTTIIDETIRTTILALTKQAVTDAVAAEKDTIEAEVRKVLKTKTKDIATSFGDHIAEVAAAGWGVRVDVTPPRG